MQDTKENSAGARASEEEKLPEKIGFPEGVLIDAPVRFDVLSAMKGVFAAINKPAGILMDSYLGAPKCKSVMLAMREQKGKREFDRLGIESPYAINQLDFEISGAALMATDKKNADNFRNAMWSGMFEFEYLVLCKAARNTESEFTVELPILMHEERPVWIVSHRFGKKAKTRFEIVKSAGDYQIWRAKANIVRPHQIRVHAAEAGLKIAGENVYSRTPPVYLSKLKEDYRLAKGVEKERPLYGAVCVHLAKIRFNGKDAGVPEIGETEIYAPPPKSFAACMKKIGFAPDSFDWTKI